METITYEQFKKMVDGKFAERCGGKAQGFDADFMAGADYDKEARRRYDEAVRNGDDKDANGIAKYADSAAECLYLMSE